MEHSDWFFSVAANTVTQADEALVHLRLACERLSRFTETQSVKHKTQSRRQNLLESGAVFLFVVGDDDMIPGIKDNLKRYVVPAFIKIAVTAADSIEESIQSLDLDFHPTVDEWVVQTALPPTT